MTSQQDRQLYIQQAFKELSHSISQQQSGKATNHNGRAIASLPFTDTVFKATTTTASVTSSPSTTSTLKTKTSIVKSTVIPLTTSKSSPTFNQPRGKQKISGAFSTADKQQWFPYSPLTDLTKPGLHHDKDQCGGLSDEDNGARHRSNLNSHNQKPYSESNISFPPSTGTNSSSSSHYSSDSVPSTPILTPMIHAALFGSSSSSSHTTKDKKMRRIPSYSSSIGSFTTHSSTRSKQQLSHTASTTASVKWDWTIEEDAYGRSNLGQTQPPCPPRSQKKNVEQDDLLISTLETTERYDKGDPDQKRQNMCYVY